MSLTPAIAIVKKDNRAWLVIIIFSYHWARTDLMHGWFREMDGENRRVPSHHCPHSGTPCYIVAPRYDLMSTKMSPLWRETFVAAGHPASVLQYRANNGAAVTEHVVDWMCSYTNPISPVLFWDDERFDARKGTPIERSSSFWVGNIHQIVLRNETKKTWRTSLHLG